MRWDAGKWCASTSGCSKPKNRQRENSSKLQDWRNTSNCHFDEYSYNWHIRNNWEKYCAEPFDFVFLDGAHNWDVDGFAFFLCNRILQTNGWILFDDLDWSYASSPALSETPQVRAMSALRQKTQQVRAIWEQLVLPHPEFGNFVEDNNWGWAQKLADASGAKQLTIRRDRRSIVRQLASAVRRTMR